MNITETNEVDLSLEFKKLPKFRLQMFQRPIIKHVSTKTTSKNKKRQTHVDYNPMPKDFLSERYRKNSDTYRKTLTKTSGVKPRQMKKSQENVSNNLDVFTGEKKVVKVNEVKEIPDPNDKEWLDAKAQMLKDGYSESFIQNNPPLNRNQNTKLESSNSITTQIEDIKKNIEKGTNSKDVLMQINRMLLRKTGTTASKEEALRSFVSGMEKVSYQDVFNKKRFITSELVRSEARVFGLVMMYLAQELTDDKKWSLIHVNGMNKHLSFQQTTKILTHGTTKYVVDLENTTIYGNESQMKHAQQEAFIRQQRL